MPSWLLGGISASRRSRDVALDGVHCHRRRQDAPGKAMLTLTLRDPSSGDILARVAQHDEGGTPFVLPLGSPKVIQEVTLTLRRGFELRRFGELREVHPGDSDILPRLAELYIRRGLLSFLEEPTWEGRSERASDKWRRRGSAKPRPVLGGDEDSADDLTQLGGVDNIVSRRALLTDDDDDDATVLGVTAGDDDAITSLNLEALAARVHAQQGPKKRFFDDD